MLPAPLQGRELGQRRAARGRVDDRRLAVLARCSRHWHALLESSLWLQTAVVGNYFSGSSHCKAVSPHGSTRHHWATVGYTSSIPRPGLHSADTHLVSPVSALSSVGVSPK